MLEPQASTPQEIEQDPPLKSVKKKKKATTRHWEAWTHDEEERFFLALRQVGKNFEKITIEVESKNKDQVRHYYYRLIKRLNKLLSSEFTLDAKNSKDVNTAMLCWWSLLEKHRCSSIKLHLKPKRQKALITALEQQLLRDRKKAKRKLTKGNLAAEVITREEPVITPAPSTRKRSSRKTPSEPSAQQASDVSNDMRGNESPLIELVVPPEAPEFTGALSRINNETPLVFGSNAPEATPEPEPEPASHVGLEMLPPKAPASDKIKLQLFPVDEPTKAALERDGHNPHLMLTLKGSKSITSVLQHLLQKWGGCSVASGELRLYPYVSDPRSDARSWSLKDAGLCAAEVYNEVGRPGVFRLRYGWSPVSASPNVFEARAQQEAHGKEENSLGFSWLYEKSTDGFGRRLWRDAVPSNDGGVSTLDWVENLTMNVSQLLQNPAKQQAPEPAYSIWGGEETCDAFSFKKKEKLQDAIILSKEKLQEAFVQSREKLQEVFLHARSTENFRAPERDDECEDVDADPLLGSSQVTSSSDMLRSSALDLYWADSLGALDGAGVQGQNLLLNNNSSLGAGVSGSLFPDSLDAFPH